MSNNKLAHTTWDCKYHIVLVPKYRRIIYGESKREIGGILRKLCEYKGVEIIEAHACIETLYICVFQSYQSIQYHIL